MIGLNTEKLKLKKVLGLIPKKKNLKVIEIGSRYGPITNFLHKKGYLIEGVDIDPEVIKKAKIMNPHIKFRCKNALDINYSKYDIIIAWGLFEYIFNLKILLKKLEKEMKKNSVLIFSVPNICSFSKRIRSIFGKNPNREINPSLVYTFRDIKKTIESLKFKYKEITTTYCDGIKNFYFPTPRYLSSEIVVKMIK